eukprot:NODE_4962_length_1089_cov_32.244306_g4409_i0.p1 GENE.NODE_4962_length_1089_cov_32.244306_g4409_i0~~NODE_4962_length_1089_cov_32.244306_g4409_i0.p1  ORF type:complete len:216 (-),score=40.68 NODE_4962_length_1089_cov_32.244306_g4409_i0:442-1035(-)
MSKPSFQPYPIRPTPIALWLVSQMELLHRGRSSFIRTSYKIAEKLKELENIDEETSQRIYECLKLVNSDDIHDNLSDRDPVLRREVLEAVFTVNKSFNWQNSFKKYQKEKINKWSNETIERLALIEKEQTPGRRSMQKMAKNTNDRNLIRLDEMEDLDNHLLDILIQIIKVNGKCLIEAILHTYFLLIFSKQKLCSL